MHWTLDEVRVGERTLSSGRGLEGQVKARLSPRKHCQEPPPGLRVGLGPGRRLPAARASQSVPCDVGPTPPRLTVTEPRSVEEGQGGPVPSSFSWACMAGVGEL